MRNKKGHYVLNGCLPPTKIDATSNFKQKKSKKQDKKIEKSI